MRIEPPLPDHAILVRGGFLKFDEIKRDCSKALEKINFYGFSVLSIQGKSALEIYDSKKQLHVPFDFIRVVEVGQIRALGLQVLPTLAENHYTIVHVEPLDYSVFSKLDAVFSAPMNMKEQV